MEATGERARPTHEKLNSELLVLAGVIAGLSEGRVRVAVSEEDETTDLQPEAAHFLKLDGKRLGRDLEMYGFIGRIDTDAAALSDFIREVLFAIKDELPAAYEVAAPMLEQLGLRLIAPEYHESWRAIFTED